MEAYTQLRKSITEGFKARVVETPKPRKPAPEPTQAPEEKSMTALVEPVEKPENHEN